MAQAISGAPATSAMDVHVTGRRVLATVVDGLFSYLVAFIAVLASAKN
jgi:hypothetical protein